MTSSATFRDRYRSDSIETMAPGRMVVALYERLSLDLDRAAAAIASNNGNAAHDPLVHAQEIVSLLSDSLDLDAWSGSEYLAAIYEFLLQQLVAANVAKDAGAIATCRELVSPLREAWREAAGIMPSGSAPAGNSSSAA